MGYGFGNQPKQGYSPGPGTGYGPGYGPGGSPQKGHVHQYGTYTSYDFCHNHTMGGTTSRTTGGLDRHVHVISGTTSYTDGHTHQYQVTTGPAIPYGRGYHVHRYNGVTTANGRGPHTHRFRGYTSPAPNDVPYPAAK